jgi:hypothetical protein
MVAAGVSGLGFMIKRTMESIDATAKLSDRLKIATEDLVALQHAAKINGMEVAGMNKAMETFVRRIGEVKMGDGQAKYALDALGLSADEMANKNHIDNLKLIADKISNLKTQSEKAAAAYYLFGRQGQQMLNLLSQGSVSIEEFRKEAERLGITFSRFDAAKVEAANDAITRAKAKLQGFVNLLTIEMAPALEAVTDKLTGLATSGEEMREKMVGSLKAITMGFAFVGNMVTVVKVALKSVAGILLGVATTVASIFSKILGLIEAAQHKLADFYNKFVEIQNKIADSKIGNKLGFEEFDKMGKVDMTSTIDAYTEGLTSVTLDMFKDVGDDLANLPTMKVGEWFKDLEQRSASLKNKLDDAAKAKENFADTGPLEDTKSVLESTKNAIESIRNQSYLTRMERIEALRQYARENAATLEKVADAHKLLNEEIENLEKSRVNQLRVYMAELREDMQNIGLFVSDKMASAANSIESSMSDAFYNMAAEGQSFKESMIGFARDIRAAFMRMAADIIARATMNAVMNSSIGAAVGGIFGGFFGGGATPAADPNPMMAHYAHGGGIVGKLSRSRSVPALAFAGAPRLHGGLLSDEFPAILQKGETVIPRGGFGNVSQQPPNVIINNNTGQPMTQQGQPRFDGRNWVVEVVASNIDQYGVLRQKIQGIK